MKPSDHWLETRWNLAKEQADTFTDLLDQLGCLGSYQELNLDAEIEAQKSHVTVLAYFADRTDISPFQSQMQTFENEACKLEGIERIPYGDWATAWKEHFHPFHLTDRVVIRPSWEEYAPKASDIVVTLDPGMAFGTGQHDTTKFCAEFICELAEKNSDLKTLVDVGCGSGILSIIAKKVGFATVEGVDIEEPAIETCLENLERNVDAAPIRFEHTDGTLTDKISGEFDVVAANIIAEALCELHDTLVSLAKPGGYVILSGILPMRSELVKSTFTDLKLLDEKMSDSWHTYLYQKT